MADTIRSKSDLATTFADNATGEISPQDLRDFMETMHPQWGSMYISSSAETTINTQSVFEKAAGTTTLTGGRNFTMPANNRLTYTGTPTIHTHMVATVSMTAAGNSKTLGISIAKNGTVITGVETKRFVGTGADIGSAAVHADVQLNTNDYIELYVCNHTDATNLTIDLMYFFVLGMFM